MARLVGAEGYIGGGLRVQIGGGSTIFISLGKLKCRPTKDITAEIDKLINKMSKQGIKFIGAYWTLGRYDSVVIFEAPDEKAAMKAGLMVADIVRTETMTAVPRSEAIRLVG